MIISTLKNKINLHRVILLGLLWFVLICKINCTLDKPTAVDGQSTIRIFVADTTTSQPAAELNAIEGALIRIFVTDYETEIRLITNANGYVTIPNALYGFYELQASKVLTNYELHGSLELQITPATTILQDTIYVSLFQRQGIVINELYYSGPYNMRGYYTDQFVELFNNSDSTHYLDGLIIARVRGGFQSADGLRFQTHTGYQFPGTGRDNPIYPGQFVVIAKNAINHQTSGGGKTSVDLTNANWEFYNPVANDNDNPAVRNLLSVGDNIKKNDFQMNLKSDEICLIRIDDPNQVQIIREDGYVYYSYSYLDVVDGVRYSKTQKLPKTMSEHIDKGYAGYAVANYSGRAIERHAPETGAPGRDTNNSSFDFVSLYSPTPHFQHDQSLVIPGN